MVLLGPIQEAQPVAKGAQHAWPLPAADAVFIHWLPKACWKLWIGMPGPRSLVESALCTGPPILRLFP